MNSDIIQCHFNIPYSCCSCGQAGKHKIILRRWVQAIRPTVHTQSRSRCCHMPHQLCQCVSYQHSHSYWEYQDSLSEHIYIIGQYFDKYKPGLSLRLRLQRSQAKPKPISSLHRGWALVGLEQARLSRLRASSPALHITKIDTSVLTPTMLV